MIELALLILLFIALSGLLAMIDAAILSVSLAEIEEMVLQKKWGAIALRSLHRKLTNAVVVVVILTNLVNVLGPILVGQQAIAQFGNNVIGVITAILTFLTIIFSEIIPKSLGAHYAPRISRYTAPVILAIATAISPIVWVLAKVAGIFQREGERPIGTEAQIRSLVTIGRREGLIESDEGQLIHRAFILNDKKAADVMTPLKDIISVSDEATIREAADKVFKNPYSRYPVFGTSVHDIKGILLSHDILEALAEGKDEESVKTILREALIVKHSQRCDQLMILFRDKHIHLAVVQEKGHTIGLITLEDVLEELVGEIEDEKDTEEHIM